MKKYVSIIAFTLTLAQPTHAAEIHVSGANAKMPGGWMIVQAMGDFMFGNQGIRWGCHALTTQKDVIFDVSTPPERGVSHSWFIDIKNDNLRDKTGEFLAAQISINNYTYKTNMALQRFNTLRFASLRDEDISDLAKEMVKGGILTIKTEDNTIQLHIHDFMSKQMRETFAYCLQQDISTPTQWYAVAPDGDIKINR